MVKNYKNYLVEFASTLQPVNGFMDLFFEKFALFSSLLGFPLPALNERTRGRRNFDGFLTNLFQGNYFGSVLYCYT